MAVHLLVETAIYDSNQFEILSYDEVEDLKKEFSFLANRIDAAKRKLALESKVRDAALSLSRLYSKKGRQRRSLLGSPQNSNQNDVTKHTDEELTSSNRKCEELSQELWRLNNRVTDIQKRLLQHSAGILGMAHGKDIKSQPQPHGLENSYTLVNGSRSLHSESEFDDRSLYRTPDKLRNFGETTIIQEDDARYDKGTVDGDFVTDRLEEMNNALRELLLQNARSQQLPQPVHLAMYDNMRGVHEQFALLNQNIQYLRQNPPMTSNEVADDRVVETVDQRGAVIANLWDIITAGENEVKNQKMLNTQNGHDTEDNSHDEYEDDDSQEFSISAFSAKVQLLCSKSMTLRQQREHMRRQLSTQFEEMENANAKITQLQDELAQATINLQAKNDELVDIMHQLDTQHKKEQRKTLETNQTLARESSALEAEREALDAERQERNELEERFVAQIQEKEDNLTDLQSRFSEVREDRDLIKAEFEAMTQETEGRFAILEEEILSLKDAQQLSEQAQLVVARQEAVLRAQLAEKEQEVTKMDQEIAELSGKVAELSTEVVMAKAELDASYGSKKQRAAATAEARAAAAALEAANKQPQSVDPTLLQEIEDLSQKNQELVDEIVALKNERANAANNEHLENRCRELQSELDGMLKDFEKLTKQSIENEQEHNKLEQIIDSMKEKNEELETALGEEKIKGLGARQASIGDIRSPSGRHLGESTSTNVLKQEFKKMMREMRADSAKSLRVCLFNCRYRTWLTKIT
ncbi:Up-regulated during septation-domain-containing protein [Geopyxis carbonaria]|nr:Up-regulated during septation-domain-containing protein [Geopyxis carbonaria]